MTHLILKGKDRLSIFATRNAHVIFAFFCILALGVSINAQSIRLRGQVDTLPSIEEYTDIYAEGNIAVIGTWKSKGALIIDITNPDAPVLAAHYNPSPAQTMLEAVVVNRIGYFGSGNGGGVHVVDLSNPYNPQLITKINSTNGGGHNSIHEIVIDGNYLYETSQNPYSSTIKVINISNPSQPVFVRNLVAQDTNFVHAVHVKNGRLFTSGWSGKTEIYDVSNIGTQTPPLLGVINSGTNSHSSWVSEDGNYLYNARELDNGDLRVYNITNPAAPTLVKTITRTSLGISAKCPHNPVVMGNLLFVAWYQAGVQVFDISNPADPVKLGEYDTYPAAFTESDSASGDAEDAICGYNWETGRAVSGYDGNWAVYPFLGLNKVILGDLDGGLYIIDVTSLLPRSPHNTAADFDGDAKTDFSQFRPATGTWYIEESSHLAEDHTIVQPFGLSTDVLAPGDYDGDGKTDIAVFRPTDGTWYMLQSFAGFKAQQFGSNGDIPVPGYLDSDSKTDIAVFRPSNGTWYAMRSADGFMSRQWGSLNDKPVAGDFDGDNLMDIGVYRPGNGTWYILTSSTGALLSRQFGASTDIPLVADFDGDSKTDFTVFRPAEGTWYNLRSSTGAFSGQQFGINGDVPVPGDYDGDGKTDFAVFRSNTASWYLLKSSNSSFEATQFGETGDRPVPFAYNPQ